MSTPCKLSLVAILAIALTAPAIAARRALVVEDPIGGGSEDAAQTIEDALVDRGFEVVRDTRVRPDFDRYCCIWDLRVFRALDTTQGDRIKGALDAGHGVDVAIPSDSDEPVEIEKGVVMDDDEGTAEYTIVRQGDRVLMKVREPIVNTIDD